MRSSTFNFSSAAQVALLLGTLLVQGCIVPTRKTHSVQYGGTVLDADTRAPVRKASVELRNPLLATHTRTDAVGNFDIGPLRCWHLYLWLPGPEPYTCKHYWTAPLTLTVAQPGYQPVQMQVMAPYTTNMGSILLQRKAEK
jgi:hypothetical protein